MPSSDYDETINQFHIGDKVREKGKLEIMTIKSNIPGGVGEGIGHYLKTDQFRCEWADDKGETFSAIFNGVDLESC